MIFRYTLTEAIFVGHLYEATIIAIYPAVIRTGKRILYPTVRQHHTSPTMLTDIVERGEIAVLSARDHNRFGLEMENEVVAWFTNILRDTGSGPSTVGSVQLTSGGAVTYRTTSSGDLEFAIGDALIVRAPATADGLIADCAFSLQGVRQ